MKLKINRLVIDIHTPEGTFGEDIKFFSGLNVLRSDNSSGKSTCINGIIYGLGLEGMITSKHTHPFPYVMVEKLEKSEGDFIKVNKSTVFLEIQNEQNEVITIKRDVKGGTDIHLVQVFKGKYNKEILKGKSTDYFVRQNGSAKNARGFHRMLENFIGWELPEVLKYNGTFTKLYLECIFPLMLIEQKRGWTSIQSNIPKQFSIKEVEKRAIEYLLDLDAYKLLSEKEFIEQKFKDLKMAWKNEYNQIITLSNSLNGKVTELSSSLSEKTEIGDFHVLVDKDGLEVDIRTLIRTKKELLNELNDKEIGTVDSNKEELLHILNEENSKYYSLERNANEMLEKYELEVQYRINIEARIKAVEEDLLKYKDVKKLQKLGSHNNVEYSKGMCPTCYQSVNDSLLPQGINLTPMTIDDNIKYLEEEKKTLKYVKEQIEDNINDLLLKLDRFQEALKNHREKIKSIKKSLYSPDNYLNEHKVREKVILEETIKHHEEIHNEIELKVGKLEDLIEEYVNYSKQIKAIPNDILSDKDKRKLNEISKNLKNYLKEFGFQSLNVEELYISEDTYRPLHDGFNLEANISASDLVRTIWSYLISLLKVAETNHLKLLIFDEPKQQSTKDLSFMSLIEETANLKEAQSIISTSESEDNIHKFMETYDGFNLINFTRNKIFSKKS